MIEISDADMIDHVIRNMRAEDRREMDAVGASSMRLTAAARQSVFCFCAFADGAPCAIWGMLHTRRGVGAAFAFGTDDWGRVLLPVVRHVREFLTPWLRANGYHRVEALAMTGRPDIERFMALVGAAPEALLQQFGCDGEDFTSYRWLAHERRGETQTAAPAYRTH
jgi:hypothetical protein